MAVEGKRARVTGQTAVAGGVVFALFATGWLLGLMLTPDGAAGGGPAALRRVAVAGTASLLPRLLLALDSRLPRRGGRGGAERAAQVEREDDVPERDGSRLS